MLRRIAFLTILLALAIPQWGLARLPDCSILVAGEVAPELWASDFLTGAVVRDMDTARRVIRMAAEDSGLRREITAQLDALKADPTRPWMEQLKTSPRLWDLYLSTVYDLVLPYNHGYRELISVMDDEIPHDAIVADLGTGTGIQGASLLLNQPGRYILAMDRSAAGLARATRKLEAAQKHHRVAITPFEVVQADLLDLARIPWPTAQTARPRAAIMSMVTYALPAERRPGVYKMIFDSLPSGSTFIADDPNGDWVKSIADMATAIEYDAVNSIEHGAPLTDKGLALGTFINNEVLMAGGGGSFGFLTQAELVKLGLEAGFRLKSTSFQNPRGDLYGRFVNTVVFEKP